MEKAAVSDDGFAGIKEEFEKQCDASMQRYNEALGYNGACWNCHLCATPLTILKPLWHSMRKLNF